MDLHDILDRATDRVDAPHGLTAWALGEARRRRARVRGYGAALVAAAAVVVLVVSVRVVAPDPDGQGEPSGPVPPTASQVPTSPEAPPVPRSAVLERWDPRGVEGLSVLDLGIPRVMPPAPTAGALTEAVALLDDDTRPLLVGAEGTAVPLELPDGIGRWRSIALSPDGSRVAAVGRAFFWRDLAGGTWQRLDRPAGIDVEATVRWVSSDDVVLSGYPATVRMDVTTGEQATLDFARSDGWWATTEDGYVTYEQLDLLMERTGDAGEVVARRMPTGPLGSLQRFAVRGSALAAVRAVTTFTSSKGPTEQDGLLALDLDTLATRAFLPLPDEATYYSDNANASVLTWLDGETVLFTVHPKDAAKEYLVAWDVETGALSRVACWLDSYDATFATDVVARAAR